MNTTIGSPIHFGKFVVKKLKILFFNRMKTLINEHKVNTGRILVSRDMIII